MKRSFSVVLFLIGVLGPHVCMAEPLFTLPIGVPLLIGVPSIPATFDPHGPAFWAPNSPLPNIYETLLARDDKGGIVPGLAQSWILSPDGRRLDFKLRPGVKFHNGEPFGAAVAKFSLDRFLARAAKQSWGVPWRVIDRVEVIEGSLLRVMTSQPAPALVELFASGGAVVEPRHFEAGEQAAVASPIGTGPFLFKHVIPNDELRMDAFQTYWGRRPSFTTVTFKAIPNRKARLAGLLNRQLAIATDLGPEDVGGLQPNSGVTILAVPSLRSVVISFDTLTPGPLADPRVRRALSRAINVDDLIRQARRGFGTKIVSPAPPTVFVPSTVKAVASNAAVARKLLAEGGYPQGLRLELDASAGQDPTDETIAELLRDQLKAVGVEIGIRRHNAAAFASLFTTGKQRPAMALLGLRSPTFDPHFYFDNLLRSARPLSGYSNPDVDARLDRALVELNTTARAALYDRVAEIAQSDVPVIPLFEENPLYGVARTISWSPRFDERLLVAQVQFGGPVAKNGTPPPPPVAPNAAPPASVGAAPPGPAAPASVSPPAQVAWNVWAEPAAGQAFRPSPFLKPSVSYRVNVDLAAMVYDAQSVSSTAVGAAFLQRLDDWKREGYTEVRLQLLALHDPAFFETPQAPVQPLRVRLNRFGSGASALPPVRDPFGEMRASAQLGTELSFLYGRAEFVVRPRATSGATMLTFSVWVDDSLPVEEFSSRVCVASDDAEARRACPGVSPVPYTLSGLDSVRLAVEGGSRPDAALHFVALDRQDRTRQIVGVFRRNDTPPGTWVTWRLRDSDTADWIARYLAGTVMPAFYNVTEGPALQSVGRGFYNTLFPQNDPGLPDADKAREAFEAFVTSYPRQTGPLPPGRLAPSIFVRAVLPPLDLFLPIGFMHVAGDYIGFSFRVEVPLPAQSYQTTAGCVTRWTMTVPPSPSDGDALDAAVGIFRSRLDDPSGWPTTAKVYRKIGDLRDWLAEPVRDLERSAIIVTSHHDRDTVFFEPGDRVFSRQIARLFAPASIAVLNGCGTGAPGATDLIAELNRRGVAAVIATGTEVKGEMAGWFLSCLAEAVDGAAGRQARLAELHFSSVQCLRNKRTQHATVDYGGQALAYLLMGNANLTLCQPRRTP